MFVFCKIVYVGVDFFNNVFEGFEVNGKVLFLCGKWRRVFYLFCSGNEN